MDLAYPSYTNVVDYSYEIIEDPTLLIDSIRAPELNDLTFKKGTDNLVW